MKQDTIEGGFLAENAWREPRWFDSQKAYEKALDASGLMLKPRKGTDHLTLDPQTLANAKALVGRYAPDLPTFQVTTRILEGQRFTVQAEIE